MLILSRLLFVFVMLSGSYSLAQSTGLYSCRHSHFQSQAQSLKELLQEEGPTRHYGFFELKKGAETVGFIPVYKTDGKTRIGRMYICTPHFPGYFFVNGAATNIKNWVPSKPNQVIKLEGLIYQDDALLSLKTKRKDPHTLWVSLSAKSISVPSKVTKDRLTLSLKLRK